MPPKAVVGQVDWLRLFRSEDREALFNAPEILARSESFRKMLRNQKSDIEKVRYAQGFLDAMEWVRDLPEKKVEEEREKQRKEQEMNQQKLNRWMRFVRG